ncbi:unnamed protein product [Toxocara canis]|uniref:Acid phosphatase 5 n=1 Tax=Toxocara canis TaxID=6265 RepID=A0A3P7GW96_TOXCA|nr:unnamed protein product [Toxocara canis]
MTGVDNRTVVSASTVLASLFPPQDDQIWKKYFNWQPIAIHTQPILDHVSFGALERCKALLKFVEKSTAYQKIVAEDSKLKSWLTALTGINVSNPILYNRVLDTLMSRANLNQLPPPIWARNGTVQKLLTNKHRRLHSQIIDIFLSQSGGWIFDQFVDAIENRINQNTNHTLLLYSAHDASIQTIGKFLSVPELDTLPSFGAYMALEHHFKDGQNIIELWYHPVLNGSRRLITIPNCTDPCSFETFKKLKPRVSSSSWMFTCQGQPPFCDDDTIVLGAMIGLTILLGILSVLLIFVCCAYRHRLNKLLDPEQQSLLHS